MRSIVNSTLLTVIPLAIAGLLFSPALNAQVVHQSKLSQSKPPQSSLPATSNLYSAGSYCQGDMQNDTHHAQYTSELRYDIDCMMTQLKDYQHDEQSPNTRYYAYKAQAWLNYAYSEDSEGSLTTAGTDALYQGLTLYYALQQNQLDQLDLTLAIPNSSSLMRPDLWATLQSLKHQGGIESNPRELAFAEVKLIWAAAEYCEFGWRHAREHFAAAERWINQSKVNYLNGNSSTSIDSFTTDELMWYNQLQPLATRGQCQGASLAKQLPSSITA